MQGRSSVALNVPGHPLPKSDREAREQFATGLVVELHVGQVDLPQRALGRLEHRAKQDVAALALKPDGNPHARVRQVEGLERRVGRDQHANHRARDTPHCALDARARQVDPPRIAHDFGPVQLGHRQPDDRLARDPVCVKDVELRERVVATQRDPEGRNLLHAQLLEGHRGQRPVAA